LLANNSGAVISKISHILNNYIIGKKYRKQKQKARSFLFMIALSSKKIDPNKNFS